MRAQPPDPWAATGRKINQWRSAMALVPFRVSGAAADQGAEERLFQVIPAPVAFRPVVRDFLCFLVMLFGYCSAAEALRICKASPCRCRKTQHNQILAIS